MTSRYSVSIEVCHLLTEYDARRLADEIRDRLNDIQEDVYVCICEYEQVRARKTQTVVTNEVEERRRN